MNSIPTEQNTPRQLQRLAAQRQLYATAKTVFGWHLVATGPVTVAFAFSVAAFPALKGFAALWGIFVTMCDIAWLTPWQKHLRDRAARIQEAFDCDVLEIPWHGIKTGNHPDPELVKQQAEKYKKWSRAMPTLSNWYPKDVGILPLHLARLVCQRANCWWDAHQRRQYANVAISFVIAIFITILVLAVADGLTAEEFVVKVVAPLSPMLVLGCRQFIEQRGAATRLDNLKEHAERLWHDALAGGLQSKTIEGSRSLQDEIFENRRKSPFVFDCLFKSLRKDFNNQMNHGAAELVTEAKQKLGLS